MFARVTDLVTVIRAGEHLWAHRISAVATVVKKFRVRSKVNVPAAGPQALPKIDAFIPRGIELLVESAHIFIRVATDHQGSRSRLPHRKKIPGLTSLTGQIRNFFETQILTHQSSDGRQVLRKI